MDVVASNMDHFANPAEDGTTSINLPHTLQTHSGMITGCGAPQFRRLPFQVPEAALARHVWFRGVEQELSTGEFYGPDTINSPRPHVQKVVEGFLENHSVSDRNLSSVHDSGFDPRKLRFAANLGACVSNVSKEDLKKWMRTRARFDLEQGAAIVVAAFMKDGRVDDAKKLVKELGGVLASSYMWVELDVPLPVRQSVFKSPEKLARRLQISAARRGIEIPLATSYKELVPLLMRVRRCKPNHQCLNIPQWMFREAGTEPPAHFAACFTPHHPVPYPTMPAGRDAIILSRQHFRSDQRTIFQLFRHWDPEKRLRKNIKILENKVLYGGAWIQERVFNLDNVALLCHYFFQYQRRLQRKVVSDLTGSGFMEEGEGRKLFQNNVAIKSSFEEALVKIVEDSADGVIVAMGDDDTLALIDQTCLLMKEYVDVYGAGNTQNLVFKKEDRGGSGRGAVDDYNLLCDVLAGLTSDARDEGNMDVPGPVHKFLAKDIMYSNNSWASDAFAGGKKAGWEDWVAKRGLVAGHEDFEVDGEWNLVMK